MDCPDCGHRNLPGEETCAHCEAPLSSLASPQPAAGMQRRILEGTVGDLAPHEAAGLPEDATVDQAVRLMRERKMGCVLVTRDGQLTGLLTERDLLMKFEPTADPKRLAVKDVMKTDPDTAQEEQPLAFAFRAMSLHGQHHLPVRRKDGSWAVVSARDLLRYLSA
ncbi:MAG: CBS domain-containing protein [Elusimicrobia bacterium]|nr:CBS domain-containing protein [Elusimicrobiota bacterium]